jgi:uncharacterized membrane protein YbhN (UPF0104 family)
MGVRLPTPERRDVPHDADVRPPAHGKDRARRVASGLVSVAVVIAVFWYFLPQYTSVTQIWESIWAMGEGEVVVLVAAATWNLCTYAFLVVATMPGLTFPQAIVVTESSTAVSNTMPGGVAVGVAMSYAMYSSWGFSKSRSTVSLMVAGIWNNFVKLGMPIVALALLVLHDDASAGSVLLALAGFAALAAAVTVFALVLRSEDFAVRLGEQIGHVASAFLRRLHRAPAVGWGAAFRTFRRRTVGLVRVRWRSITVAAVVSHLSLFAVLLISLRAVGVTADQVSWVEALVVFAFARLVTAIPVTPAGVGIVEVALMAGLSTAGGPRPQVAAAVLVFRALTYVLPIPLGVATYVFWRRNRSWRRAPGTAPRPPGLELEPQGSEGGAT